MKNDVLVSACLITFNQVNYIEECIKGALNQKIDNYEIIIGDDCSTDGTSKICKKYAELYPFLIRYFKREQNLGMKGNWVETIQSANGKYIAICEGDDYWLDPLKLQKQVDFLEKNEEFVGVFTDINLLTNDSVEKRALKEKHRTDHDFSSFFKNAWIPTLSIVFRKSSLTEYFEIPNTVMSLDIVLFAYLLTYGKLKFMDEVTGVYRKHSGGLWSSANQLQILNNRVELNRYFKKRYANNDKSLNAILKKRIQKSYFKKAKLFKRKGDYINMTLSLIKSKL
jgi:glycosyltransferase involved in cell wall biosynthesis